MTDTHPLIDLLDKERQIILNGAFDGLEEIASQKENLLAEIGQKGAEATALNCIQYALDRNLNLLTAAIEGVKSVRDYLSEIRKMRDGFEAYDRTGVKTNVGGGNTGFEHKA